jgi:hypothetical protein
VENVPLLRNSERSAFKRCQMRWWWSFREGLVSKVQKPDALWFGTGIHLAFAEHYIPGTVRGRDPIEVWEEYVGETLALVKTSNQDEVAEYTDAKELGTIMLKAHFDEFGNDEHWEVLAPEQVFSVLIEDPDNPGVAIVNLVGTFDAVYRNLKSGKIWILDHKTAKAIDTGHLVMDDQAGTYVAVAPTYLTELGWLKEGENIEGIMYNYLAKRKPDPRPRDDKGRYLNKDGSVSKVQPPKTLYREPVRKTQKQNAKQIERIGREAQQMNDLREWPEYLTKNPTRDCKWDCPFFDMCQVHESGGDFEEFKRGVFNIEDPYHDHRVGAKNTKESVAAMRQLRKG